MMVEALRAKGLPVAYVAFEGEQHGFRRAENIKRALDGELYFYSRVFGFELADEVEPVHDRKSLTAHGRARRDKKRGRRTFVRHPFESPRREARKLRFRR